jgi:hypothetical protein
MQCSSQFLACTAFPKAAAKSQNQKLVLLPRIPQTLFLLQFRAACNLLRSTARLAACIVPLSQFAQKQPGVPQSGAQPLLQTRLKRIEFARRCRARAVLWRHSAACTYFRIVLRYQPVSSLIATVTRLPRGSVAGGWVRARWTGESQTPAQWRSPARIRLVPQ